MRVEDRTGVMKPEGDKKTPNVIFICEHESEARVVDLLGKPGDRVTGELHLSDGYGEFYVRLEPLLVSGTMDFTKKVREYIFREYGHVPGNELSMQIYHLMEATNIIDIQQAAINEALEVMDDEPAKEILRKAVDK